MINRNEADKLKQYAQEVLDQTSEFVEMVYIASDGSQFSEEHEAMTHDLICSCLALASDLQLELEQTTLMIGYAMRLAKGEEV